MAHIPASVGKHLDVLRIRDDGHLLLGTSNLSYRYWNGSLWYFKNADLAPDVLKCDAGTELGTGINDMQCFKGNDNIVIGTDLGAVQLWQLNEDGQLFSCLAHPSEHDGIVTSVSINADQTRVVSSSYDRRIMIWNTEEFASIRTYTGHCSTVRNAAFHPKDPHLLVSCSQDGNVLLWDLRKSKPATKLNNTHLNGLPTYVTWQPTEEYSIVVGTETGNIIVQNTKQNSCETIVGAQPHTRAIRAIEFCPQNPTWFASVSEDCTAVVTEYAAGSATPIYRDDSHTDFVQGVAWHPDGRLFTCGWDFAVKARQVEPNLGSSSQLILETEKVKLQEDSMDTVTPEDKETAE